MSTKEELKAIAKAEGDWRVIRDVGDLRWEEVDDFPVSEFIKRKVGDLKRRASKADWIEWLSNEKAGHDSPEYYSELEAAWTGDPKRVGPIIIAYTKDGRIDIGDGWHRVAMAVVNGMRTIPAIVGTPK